MLKFKNQNQLCLEQEKLKFRHTHFSDLSEFESFAKGFSGNGFHLGDQSFECYISQVLTDNIKLGLYQNNCQLLYRGTSLNNFTFSFSAFHYGSLFSYKYKTDPNMINIVYLHQEIAEIRQKFHGNYVLVFEDKFFNNFCEALELSEWKKRLDGRKIPSVIKVDCQKINYLRQLCHQIYKLLFQITAHQPDASFNPLLINHDLKRKLEEEVAKTLIVALAESTEIKLKKPHIKRTCILKKAEEFYLSNLKSTITTQDVYQELEISQRSLEYLFKDYYQMSPQKYFKRLRLNALHQELLQTDEEANLGEIAERFGFYHRGQLARNYSQIFGHLPSKTFNKF